MHGAQGYLPERTAAWADASVANQATALAQERAALHGSRVGACGARMCLLGEGGCKLN